MRRVKDFIDISEYTSLDQLIHYLETIRDNLPPEHQAEMKIRGDEVFGKRLTITYFREQTPEEAELKSKYAGGEEDGASIERCVAASTTCLTIRVKNPARPANPTGTAAA